VIAHTYTHDDLVSRAEKWLRNTKRYGVVLTECHGEVEQPDAIAWKYSGRESAVVECKVTRSDFLADQKKTHRNHSSKFQLGRYRWYMVPRDLITADEVPDGWGLLYVRGRRVTIEVDAPRHSEIGWQMEMGLLVSELRKFQIVLGGGNLLPSASTSRIQSCLSRVLHPLIASISEDEDADSNNHDN